MSDMEHCHPYNYIDKKCKQVKLWFHLLPIFWGKYNNMKSQLYFLDDQCQMLKICIHKILIQGVHQQHRVFLGKPGQLFPTTNSWPPFLYNISSEFNPQKQRSLPRPLIS